MNRRTLVLRTLRYRWRGYLGVLLGAAVGSAALIGALVVGDSVRGSLRAQALQRLGWVHFAVAPHDRFFTQELGAPDWPTSGTADTTRPALLPQVAVVLRLPATAARQDGAARANQTQVLGVRSNFWPASIAADFAGMPRGSMWINQSLAAQLNAQVGDGLVLRVHKPSALSREVPITPQADASIALRLTVHHVVRSADLGNFDLHSGAMPSLNAFVHLDDLDAAAGLDGRANLLLAGAVDSSAAGASEPRKLVEWLTARVRLADYAINTRVVTNAEASSVEIWTDRIFLDPGVTAKALGLPASSMHTPAVQGVLTYLVNRIASGDRAVPYSMVTAAGPPWTTAGLNDDEIIVNEWLANQLAVQAGDSVDLTYYLPESGASLVERTNRFRVHSVVPIEGVYDDRTLMPEFPGLAKAESTHDWDAGFPLVHKIRDEDEAYWKKYRGTPKAYVSWASGQAMWTNRFGNATAVRWATPSGPGADGANKIAALTATVQGALRQTLSPAEFGLVFDPVRQAALASSAQAQDFGQLFLGFSFFLILAALILMALLFQFGLEQRTTEVGTLLALGFTPGRVRTLLLVEGVAIAVAGGAVGVAGGVFYARAMLQGLTTIWRDAIGASTLQFYVTPLTLVIGLTSSVIVCVATIWIVLRRQARRPARSLLAEGAEFGINDDAGAGGSRGSGALAGWIALGSAVTGGGLIAWALFGDRPATAPIFFGAGSLWLIAGLAGSAWWLRRMQSSATGRALTLATLGWRGVTRRRTRSLASVALLASGSFLIVAVGANRLDADRDATARTSGTGGFRLIGESALPVVRDLNTVAGREFYGIDERKFEGVRIVPFRVRDGDEASCLNLQRAQQPRLLGVQPDSLSERGAFTFAGRLDGMPADQPWLGLRPSVFNAQAARPLAADEIPAIGDAASIQWALQKKLGDTLEYTDERGRGFKVRLVGAVVNSVLQGSLVIDEAEFVRRFPGESGHRMFLIDVPSNQPPTNVAAVLSRALQDVGMQLTVTSQRLAAFNAVQNTYLNTFQILGGLGLLLGSAGLGVVVLRNVLERRAELGLLQAVGFRRGRLQWLVLSEHGGLLGLGLLIGMTAALVSVLPVLLAPGAALHTTALGATLAGVLASGALFTWMATRWALRGRLLDALRSE